MARDARDEGRALLAAWKEAAPNNFFASDANARQVLPRHIGAERYAALAPSYDDFGAACATTIDAAVRETNRAGALPQLRRYDGIGRRTEEVVFHPDYHRIGERVYATGVMSGYDTPGHEASQLVYGYLFSHNGEAGHACPLACTAGLIKILQARGDDALKQRFLPRLLDPDYHSNFVASQFLTEVQGGSDVGRNAVIARPAEGPDGSYRIHGEKWFCSVANADVFLMTARPEGASDGTRGLGAFLVPRILKDGRVNDFAIRRLKDKLGTRSMASAEIDFNGAWAYPIGRVDEGFKNVIELVLTTSRVHNAVCCAAFMRRAEIEAFGFAHHRQAFGRPIAAFPLVQRTLANIRVAARAAFASSFALAAMGDELARGEGSEARAKVFRALVPLNKMLTAIRGSEAIHDAMEVLAGNGAIEDFSVLPRLYRDAYVLEAWEGTHNVLSAQFLRDLGKFELGPALLAFTKEELERPAPAGLDACRASLSRARDRLTASMSSMADPQMARNDPALLSLLGRDIAVELMTLVQGLNLLRESSWAEEDGHGDAKALVLEHFVARRIDRRSAAEDPGLTERIARLSALEMTCGVSEAAR